MYYPEAKALHICIPDRPEQEAIIALLGALDDKVEANFQLRQLLDDSWLARATFALRDAESRNLSVLLTSLASFINGRAFTKGATGTGRMVIRIAELNSGPGGSTIYNNIEVLEEHLARPGDLLFAWSGSLTVHRWFRQEAIINQHIFKVTPSHGVPMWLVHAHLLRLLDHFRGIAADKATTMGHIQRRHLEVPVPNLHEEALVRADAVCAPLWTRALAAERESLALQALRDALLPPLLSGELRVREAESLVGDAV
jgi:type I restriction enzyme S subunit